MSMVYQEQQRQVAAASEARRQAEIAERQRQEAIMWERQRQRFQEQLLQQEQNRRGSETQGNLQNQRRSIDSNLELGKYGEHTKRMGQGVDLAKAKLANQTAKYGFDSMGKMFGGGQTGPQIDLHDSGGKRIGGTMGGGIGKTPYQSQNFSLRSSLLAPGG